eukprot:TRINITY_DN4385_c0_g2_i1.p1 TRINITY_DN4385_c0_g2~~TRINITY_DN4385_c0_g2_i1.p1  ORF type:complete len:394 (-),score=93.21 TRINITY_DN4385_c0_g2_i1:1690-2871(-)
MATCNTRKQEFCSWPNTSKSRTFKMDNKEMEVQLFKAHHGLLLDTLGLLSSNCDMWRLKSEFVSSLVSITLQLMLQGSTSSSSTILLDKDAVVGCLEAFVHCLKGSPLQISQMLEAGLLQLYCLVLDRIDEYAGKCEDLVMHGVRLIAVKQFRDQCQQLAESGVVPSVIRHIRDHKEELSFDAVLRALKMVHALCQVENDSIRRQVSTEFDMFVSLALNHKIRDDHSLWGSLFIMYNFDAGYLHSRLTHAMICSLQDSLQLKKPEHLPEHSLKELQRVAEVIDVLQSSVRVVPAEKQEALGYYREHIRSACPVMMSEDVEQLIAQFATDGYTVGQAVFVRDDSWRWEQGVVMTVERSSLSVRVTKLANNHRDLRVSLPSCKITTTRPDLLRWE